MIASFSPIPTSQVSASNQVFALATSATAPLGCTAAPPTSSAQERRERRRWAMLIKRIYQTDPLRCPKCGGTMRIVSFIEAWQQDLIRKILEHCGLWRDAPARAPPKPFKIARPRPPPDPGTTCDIDPDYLEHKHREQFEQPDLPWEP